MATNYQVNEIYNTIQGEGVYTGRAATFIRLQGCSVGCSWCDTKYTWLKGGTRMTAADVVQHWGNDVQPLVVITGGEPTLYDLDDLILAVKAVQNHLYRDALQLVQLETSGQNGLKGSIAPDWVTWSPKENLGFSCNRGLIQHVCEIKFVVDANLTYEKVRSVIRTFQDTTGRTVPVVLMPEGTPPKPENAQKAMDWVMEDHDMILGDRLQWRLGIR